MRSIFSLLALFSLGLLHAQAPLVSSGREPVRGELIVYPTAAEAAAADGGDNRYFTRLKEWGREGNTFAAEFTRPFAWANRQVLFRLAWASAPYEVTINGETVARVADANTPAEVDLTKYAREGRNTLTVVLAAESPVAPLESWRGAAAEPAVGPAWVASRPVMHIRDVLVRSWEERDGTGVTAEVGVVVRSGALNPRTSRIHYELLTPAGETAAAGHKDLTLDMRREDTVRFLARIPDNLLWRAGLPTHYTLRLKTQHEGRYGEYAELRVGFRTVGMREGRLCVNGEPVTLRVREVRPGMDENDLSLLRERGYNAVRPLPGICSESLLRSCDELGLYVVMQAPLDTSASGPSRRRGGNPSNEPAWEGAFVERTADSYHFSKRHPSVVAFSLAGDSANGICLYESYLNMKRMGDSRPVVYLWAGGEWNSDPLTLE